MDAMSGDVVASGHVVRAHDIERIVLHKDFDGSMSVLVKLHEADFGRGVVALFEDEQAFERCVQTVKGTMCSQGIPYYAFLMECGSMVWHSRIGNMGQGGRIGSLI